MNESLKLLACDSVLNTCNKDTLLKVQELIKSNITNLENIEHTKLFNEWVVNKNSKKYILTTNTFNIDNINNIIDVINVPIRVTTNIKNPNEIYIIPLNYISDSYKSFYRPYQNWTEGLGLDSNQLKTVDIGKFSINNYTYFDTDGFGNVNFTCMINIYYKKYNLFKFVTDKANLDRKIFVRFKHRDIESTGYYNNNFNAIYIKHENNENNDNSDSIYKIYITNHCDEHDYQRDNGCPKCLKYSLGNKQIMNIICKNNNKSDNVVNTLICDLDFVIYELIK